MEDNEFENSIRLTKKAFLIFGVAINESENMKVFLKFFYYFNLIWLHTDVFAEFFWLVEGIKLGKRLDELSFVAPCSTMCLLATAKSIQIVLNKDTLESAVKKLKELHPNESTGNYESCKNYESYKNHESYKNYESIKNYESFERKTAKEAVKFLNMIMIFQTVCCGAVLVIFFFLPLMMMAYEYYLNGETDLKLPFMAKYFFDPYANKKIWGFMYFHQVWSTTVVCMNVFAIDTLFYAFCTYIQMHFRILGHHFENVISDDHDETRAKMRRCVMRHQELIALVDQIEILYSKSTLFNVLSSSLLICLSGFNITLVEDMSATLAFIPFLVVSLTQISLMCFYGDMLVTSSTQLRDAMYNCRWYDAPQDIKRCVYLVLMRARKPCKVTAAKFAVLNLTAFTTILSRSWSYFALLKTMYD